MGINSHTEFNEFSVKKRYSSFQSMGHRHAVNALKIEVVKAAQYGKSFLMKSLRIVEVGEMTIARKEFISPLTSQDNFYIFTSQSGNNITRYGTPNQGGIIGFQMINDLRQEVDHFSFSINIFVMDSAEMRSNNAGGFRSGEWG